MTRVASDDYVVTVQSLADVQHAGQPCELRHTSEHPVRLGEPDTENTMQSQGWLRDQALRGCEALPYEESFATRKSDAGTPKMTCTKIFTKKYKTRKSPPYHAGDCKNQVKKGNDGTKYISIANKTGVYTWKSYTTNVTRKHKAKIYKILKNASTEFDVEVYPRKVSIYKMQYDEELDANVRKNHITSMSYKNIFIGDNGLSDSGYVPKGKYPGNSLLLELRKGEYMYIGSVIYTFQTVDNESIVHYYSPVGNSVLPYPSAIGESHTYLMLDKVSIPNTYLDLKKDAYTQYYTNKSLENVTFSVKVHTIF